MPATQSPIREQHVPGPSLPRPVQTARWIFRWTRVMERCRERYGDVFTLDLAPRAVAGPRAELDRWPIGEPFPLWPRMQAITLEVIVRAVFGISGATQVDHVRGLLRD